MTLSVDSTVGVVITKLGELATKMDGMAGALASDGKMLFFALATMVLAYRVVINILEAEDVLDHIRDIFRFCITAGSFAFLIFNYNTFFHFKTGYLMEGVNALSTQVLNSASLKNIDTQNPVEPAVVLAVKGLTSIWVANDTTNSDSLSKFKEIDERAAKARALERQRCASTICSVQPPDNLDYYYTASDAAFVSENKSKSKSGIVPDIGAIAEKIIMFIPMVMAKIVASIAIMIAAAIYTAMAVLLRLEYNIGAAVGPIMIAFGIFQPLSFLFESWLRYIFGVAFAYLVMSVIMGFSALAFETFGAINISDTSAYAAWGSAFAITVLCVICSYMLLNITSIAKSIVGGGGGAGIGAMASKMSKTATGGGVTGAKPGGAAGAAAGAAAGGGRGPAAQSGSIGQYMGMMGAMARPMTNAAKSAYTSAKTAMQGPNPSGGGSGGKGSGGAWDGVRGSKSV